MLKAIKRLFSRNNKSPFPLSDLPSDMLFHSSSFLDQKEFANLMKVLGPRVYLKGSDLSNENLSHEDKADDSLDVPRINQEISSSSVMSSKTASARGLLYNSNAFHQMSKVGQLLKATGYADYEQVKALIARDPSLMFKTANLKFYYNGRSECISPLRYAFKVYDTYMWKTVFYERIKDNEVHRKEFLKQMQEQEKAGHIDLEPLFQAYEEDDRQFQRWRASQISLQALSSERCKLGEKQKALLPVHMLKEFSRKGNTWRTNASFDVDRMPWPSNCRISKISLRRIIDDKWPLSCFLSASYCGSFLLLIRGDRMVAGVGATGKWHNMCALSRGASMHDLASLRRLLDVRRNDFAILISENALESQEQPHQRMEAR